MPLEHTVLAAAPAGTRTGAFARYSFIGSMFGASARSPPRRRNGWPRAPSLNPNRLRGVA